MDNHHTDYDEYDEIDEKPPFYQRRWFVWLRRLFLLVILALVAWYSFVLWFNNKASQYSDWNEGMGISKDDKGKFGYVNYYFKLKINHQFDYADKFEDGFAITGTHYGEDMKYRLIDKTGRYVGEFYDSLVYLGEHLYKVKQRTTNKADEKFEDNEWQVMNNQGKIISKRTYHSISEFQEQRARVCIKKQCAFIDPLANEVIPFSDKIMDTGTTYDFRRSLDAKATNNSNFNNGLGVFFSPQDNKYGYLDKYGNIVIEPQFSKAEPFSEGLASVEQHDGMGVIDTTGKFIVNPDTKIEKIEPFAEGRATFQMINSNYKGVLDNQGNEIVSPSRHYTYISFYNKGYAIFTVNGLQGVIDTTGKEIIPPMYSDLSDLGDLGDYPKGGRFRAMVIKDDKSELLFINTKNEIVERKQLTTF